MNRAGIHTGPVGVGCGSWGAIDDVAVASLVDRALALGVTFFDSARSYGDSEEKLGRALGHRGSLATKGGYGVEPIPEWTPQAITAGIRRALQVTRRPRLEVFFLHSCPLHVLRQPGLVEALEQAKADGFIGASGYSGDGASLAWCVDSGRFDAVQASYSLFDQANAPILQRAKEKGMLVVLKRALGGSVWERAPSDEATTAYAQRMATMQLQLSGGWLETAVRFAACASFVDVMLLGTRSPTHLEAAVIAAAKGPLDEGLHRHCVSRFDQQWPAHI
jgi:aryl-alcohol dehydrogenase-like predicted oxidoreductase